MGIAASTASVSGSRKLTPGCGDRFLDIHPIVDQIHDYLRNGLSDGVSARGAEGRPRTTLPEYDGGTVPGKFSLAGMGIHGIAFGFEGAVGQGIVEPDAGPMRHDPAAESIPQCLSGGNDVAPTVRDHKMRGVLSFFDASSRRA